MDFGWSNPSAIVANAFDPDGRGYVVDEFYKTETTDEELADAAKDMQTEWGKGVFYCDARFPQSILKLCRAGLNAKPYTYKREDGLRELGSRFCNSKRRAAEAVRFEALRKPDKRIVGVPRRCEGARPRS